MDFEIKNSIIDFVINKNKFKSFFIEFLQHGLLPLFLIILLYHYNEYSFWIILLIMGSGFFISLA